MSTANKQLIDLVNDAFSAGDVEKILSHFYDDAVWEMVGQPVLKGKDAIRTSMKEMEGHGVPEFTVGHTIAEEDRVVCVGEIKTKMTNGNTWEGSFCDNYLIIDGKIAELRAFVIGKEIEQ